MSVHEIKSEVETQKIPRPKHLKTIVFQNSNPWKTTRKIYDDSETKMRK